MQDSLKCHILSGKFPDHLYSSTSLQTLLMLSPCLIISIRLGLTIHRAGVRIQMKDPHFSIPPWSVPSQLRVSQICVDGKSHNSTHIQDPVPTTMPLGYPSGLGVPACFSCTRRIGKRYWRVPEVARAIRRGILGIWISGAHFHGPQNPHLLGRGGGVARGWPWQGLLNHMAQGWGGGGGVQGLWQMTETGLSLS